MLIFFKNKFFMPYLWNFLLFSLNCHISDMEDILINCGICIPKGHVLKFLPPTPHPTAVGWAN